MRAAHGVPDADDGTWHLRTEVVDHEEEVAWVIEPGGCRCVRWLSVLSWRVVFDETSCGVHVSGDENDKALEKTGREDGGLTIIPKLVLVQHARLALVCYICNPYVAYSDVRDLQPYIYLIPEWLVEFLWYIVNVCASHVYYLWLTFGKPLACAPMMVRSPGCGSGLSSGVYCLMAKCRTSSWVSAVALANSRICAQGKVCC